MNNRSVAAISAAAAAGISAAVTRQIVVWLAARNNRPTIDGPWPWIVPDETWTELYISTEDPRSSTHERSEGYRLWRRVTSGGSYLYAEDVLPLIDPEAVLLDPGDGLPTWVQEGSRVRVTYREPSLPGGPSYEAALCVVEGTLLRREWDGALIGHGTEGVVVSPSCTVIAVQQLDKESRS